MNSDIKKVLVLTLLVVTLVSCTDATEEKEVSENDFIEHEAGLEENIKKVSDVDSKDFDLYNYVKYSKSDIEESKKLNVLFFNDNELESIKTLKNNLMKTKIHDGLVMYEIDFNTDSEFKAKYDVTTAHTFVQVDNDFNIIRKWEGSESIGEMHTALTSTKTMVK